MTPEQITAIQCAYADLKGSLEHRLTNTLMYHNWPAHEQSIADLIDAFPELSLNEENLLNDN